MRLTDVVAHDENKVPSVTLLSGLHLEGRHMSGMGFYRAIEAGIGAAANTYGSQHSCRPLRWELASAAGTPVLTGIAGAEYAGQDVADVLAAWAELLGLSDPATREHSHGTRDYTGTTGGLQVEIWGVIDRPAFYRDGWKAS